MDSNSQTVNLSDQIPRLYGSLTVVIGSENSKLDPGLVHFNFMLNNYVK